jgi:hypothetical protein
MGALQKMSKDTSAALHGSPPLSVAAMRPSEDADRSVRRTKQTLVELREWIIAKAAEVQRDRVESAQLGWNEGQWYRGVDAGLTTVLAEVIRRETEGSGAANRVLSKPDSDKS